MHLKVGFMKTKKPCFAKTFTFSRVMFVLAIIGVILLLRLGFWQIERGHEKQAMLATFAAQKDLPAIFWDAHTKLPSQYQKIQIKGRFLPKIFLLDNQFRNHKFGFDVIQALLLENGWIVLVDRGWEAVASRNDFALKQLPTYPAITSTSRGLSAGSMLLDRSLDPADKPRDVGAGEKNERLPLEITGMAYYPSSKGFVLGEPLEKISKDLVIIETQDTLLLSKLLHKSVYPFIIRESENSRSPFLQQWPVVSMQPSRHYAYALQWFGLAIVLIIILIILKKKHA